MADERDLDAAERALGLDPIGAETAADAAMRAAWEERFAPLAGLLAPVDPPEGLYDRIEAALPAAPAAGPDAGDGDAADPAQTRREVVELAAWRRRAARWKGVAGLAAAIAAALAIYVALPRPPAEADRYVAVVTHDQNGQAGLVIQIEPATGLATVIPVAAPPDGASYEMWTIPEGRTTPVSLGLLPQQAVERRNFTAAPDQLFAISLEPEGGSPTGQPTQPLFHGRVVRVD